MTSRLSCVIINKKHTLPIKAMDSQKDEPLSHISDPGGRSRRFSMVAEIYDRAVLPNRRSVKIQYVIFPV